MFYYKGWLFMMKPLIIVGFYWRDPELFTDFPTLLRAHICYIQIHIRYYICTLFLTTFYYKGWLFMILTFDNCRFLLA